MMDRTKALSRVILLAARAARSEAIAPGIGLWALPAAADPDGTVWRTFYDPPNRLRKTAVVALCRDCGGASGEDDTDRAAIHERLALDAVASRFDSGHRFGMVDGDSALLAAIFLDESELSEETLPMHLGKMMDSLSLGEETSTGAHGIHQSRATGTEWMRI